MPRRELTREEIRSGIREDLARMRMRLVKTRMELIRKFVEDNPKKLALGIGIFEGAVIGGIAGGLPGALMGVAIGAAVGLATGAIGEASGYPLEVIAIASLGALAAPTATFLGAGAGLALGVGLGGAAAGAGAGYGTAIVMARRGREQLAEALIRIRELEERTHAQARLRGPAPLVTRKEAAQHVAREKGYSCPITLNIMNDPVVAADGHSYERSALVEWIAIRRARGDRVDEIRSPLTEETMSSSFLPNQILKTQIIEFRGFHLLNEHLVAENLVQTYPTPEAEETARGYLCPITGCVMEDPVVAADGFSYERAAIVRYMETRRASGSSIISPMTRGPIALLLTNRVLKFQIEDFQRRNPVLPVVVPETRVVPELRVVPGIMAEAVVRVAEEHRLIPAVQVQEMENPARAIRVALLVDAARRDYICPLTRLIMKDPVLAGDGYNYEREALVRYIENKAERALELISPRTKEPMKAMFIANRAHQEAIKDFLRLNPELPATAAAAAGIRFFPPRAAAGVVEAIERAEPMAATAPAYVGR